MTDTLTLDILSEVERLVSMLMARKGGAPITSPMEVLRIAMELVDKMPKLSGQQKKECVIAALQVIAAGRDGKMNTQDDLIPPHVLEGLKTLVNNGDLIKEAIELIIAATKGQLDVNKTMSFMQRLFSCLAALCGPRPVIHTTAMPMPMPSTTA